MSLQNNQLERDNSASATSKVDRGPQSPKSAISMTADCSLRRRVELRTFADGRSEWVGRSQMDRLRAREVE